MKKTRKVLSIVTAVVLVLYFSSMAVLYGNMRQTVKSYISDEAYTLVQDFNSNSYKSLNHFVSITNQSLPMYPTKYYVYDEKGEKLLAQTSNQIMFEYSPALKTGVINLDEYLSQEKLEALEKMDSKYSSNYSTFKFAVDGDKIIPCSLVFRMFQPYGKDGETFTFTDTKPTDEISCVSKYFELDLYKEHLADYQKKDYDYIDKEFKNDNVTKAEYEENKTDPWKNAIDYSDETFIKNGKYVIKQVTGLYTEDDNAYYVVTYTAANLFKNITEDYRFTRWATGLTSFFAVSLVISLAVAYNIMKKEQMKTAKYAFSNAAAHELKTPLAIIQNRCELVMEKVNEDKNDEYVKSIYEESIRMNKLVKNLLQYNSLTMNSNIDKKACDLDRIVKKEIEKYRPLAASKDVGIENLAVEKCSVKCNDELIGLVIDNFLSNAVKFATPKTVIKVSLTKKGKKLKLGVYNKGEKISKEQKKELWELLYKGDMSRNRDENSSGMGLAISRQILELHGFKYGIENKEDGVEFYFIAK